MDEWKGPFGRKNSCQSEQVHPSLWGNVNDMKLIKKEITLPYFQYVCMFEGRLMVEIMAYVPVTEQI